MNRPRTGSSTQQRLRVLHLVGSEVSIFMGDLSRLYADDCLRATADPDLYDTHVAFVSPGGTWRFPGDLSEESVEAATPLSFADAVSVLSDLRLDVVVPQMFCLPGMTTYRSLFEHLGVPCLGNTAEVMAVAAHKARAKAVVAGAGVRVPRGEVLAVGEQPTVPLPAVVKPVDADNSLGVALVRHPDQWAAALASASEYSDGILVEEYVELGREVRCGVLEVDGELVCLPLEEYSVDRDAKPIRAYADKLRRDTTDDLHGVGDLALVAKDAEHAWIVDRDDPATDRVWAAARACHRALGCRDYSLFDFRIDDAGEPWFLEAGLYCSFAEKSVITVMARAAGIPLGTLFRTSLEQAVARRTARSVP
jgi:D-alanine-D-alanine ligase